MTIQSQTWRHTYTSTGGTEYPYTFRILDASHLNVYANGTLKALNTDYTVDGVGDAVGGTVTFLVAPAAGQTVIIVRSVPFTQLTDFVENDNGLAETKEDAADKACMLSQQLREKLDRTLSFPESSTSTLGVLPEPVVGKTLEWSATVPPTLRNVTPAVTGISVPISTLNGGWGADVSVKSGNVTMRSGTIYWPENTIDIATFGASPSQTASYNAGAIQDALDSVDEAKGATIIGAPGIYLIDDMLTISKNSTVLQGYGYRSLTLKCTTAGSGLTISKGGTNIIYGCGLNRVAIDGDDLSTAALTIHNLSEGSFQMAGVYDAATGVEFTGDYGGLLDFYAMAVSGCAVGMRVSGTLSHAFFTAANFYDCVTAIYPNFANNLIFRDSWFETFSTALLLQHGVAESTILATVKFRDCYFLSTSGGVGNTCRVIKSSGDVDSTANIVQPLILDGCHLYLTNAAAVCEVAWGATYSTSNRLGLHIRNCNLYGATNTTEWVKSDVTIPWVQPLWFHDNLYPATVVPTTTPERHWLSRSGAQIIETANLPAAGDASDGLIVIENAGAASNVVFYMGGKRFKSAGTES